MARFLLVLLAAIVFLGQKQTNAAIQRYCSAMVNQTSKQVDGLMSGVLLLNKQAHECDKRLDHLEAELIVLKYQVSNQLQNQVDQLQKLLQRKYCARQTIAEGLETTLIINRTTQFTVLMRDFEGHDLSSGGHNITVTLTSLDFSECSSSKPKITDNDDGSYLVSLTPECSGNNQITVSIEGKVIKGMPVTVAVIPSYASLKLKRKINLLNGPRGINTAKNGDIFVAGWSNGNLYKFDKSGKKLSTWRVPGTNTHTVLVHEDIIYVAQCNPKKILKYALNQTLVESISVNDCYLEIQIGPDGRLYGTNWNAQRVDIFNTNSGTVSLFHEISGTPSPQALAFDPQGNVHVTNYVSTLVRVFSPSGVFIHSYTPPSASVGCRDIYIDKAGNVLVQIRSNPNKVIITDKDNNLLQKFTIAPPSFASSFTIASNGDVWVTVPYSEIFIYSH